MTDKELFNLNISVLIKKDRNLAKKISEADSSKSTYTGITTAKNGMSVVLFANSRPMYSLYNPTPRSQTETSEKTFYLVTGLGNGYHFQYLLENGKNRILVVEKDTHTLKFLFSHQDFSSILQSPNFLLCTVEELPQKLTESYIPQTCGIFNYTANRVWAENNPETEKNISDTVQSSLKQISADYSVQAHFGKIWQRNIIENLFILSKQKNTSQVKIPAHKKAAIVAAGPSLDKSIVILTDNRDEYYIIATDTASQVLFLNGVVPDAVVSVDGQNISYRHFLKTSSLPNTIYVLDLCANPAISKAVANNSGILHFAASSHPLCAAAAAFFKEQTGTDVFPFLDSSSGTVTGAALDFAIKAGFANIELFGADFAYSNGKPYCKGSYLDETFNNSSLRTETQETAFSALMFRTPLIYKQNGVTTTETLSQYDSAVQQAALQHASAAKISKISSDLQPYTLIVPPNCLKKQIQSDFFAETLYNSLNFADFITWILKSIREAKGKSQADIITALLPFAAWCEKKGFYQSSKDSFDRVLDLAHDFFKRYAE